jgi:hypothetical protein
MHERLRLRCWRGCLELFVLSEVFFSNTDRPKNLYYWYVNQNMTVRL